jgi:hypothetical protein
MSAFQVEMAFERLKRRKSLSVDQITAELALEGGGKGQISMRLLSAFRLKKDSYSRGRIQSLHL